MKRMTRLIVRHRAGDAKPTLSLPTLGGTIHLERTDETLIAYGGLVAYSTLVKKLGWLDDLAARFPVSRTSPNALSVVDVLRGFELNCLCEGAVSPTCAGCKTISPWLTSWGCNGCPARMRSRA